MQPLYRLKTQKLFEKNKAGGAEVLDEDPYAVTKICLAPDCRTLAVAGQTDQVLLYRYGKTPSPQCMARTPPSSTSLLYRFRKKDCLAEIPCLEIPIIYEVFFHTAHCTPYTAHHTLHTIHCTPYTTHHTLHTIHCTPYTAHHTLLTTHWTADSTPIIQGSRYEQVLANGLVFGSSSLLLQLCC